MTDFESLITALADAGVEFIIVGGFAATVHGAARTTFDLKVVYARTPQNLVRVVRALESLSPYPRGAPPNLPFRGMSARFGSVPISR